MYEADYFDNVLPWYWTRMILGVKPIMTVKRDRIMGLSIHVCAYFFYVHSHCIEKIINDDCGNLSFWLY